MNILITGGTGFIGSHLTHKLLTVNHNISILKRRGSNLSRIKDIEDQISFFEYQSFNDLKSIFESKHFDLIIHLAGLYIKFTDKWEDIKKMNDTNISFSATLLQLAINNNTKAFINTGTCFEYQLPKIKIKENDLIQPFNYYAATKIAFEDLFKFFVVRKNIRGITLKPFYAYGEKNNQKIIPAMINAIIKNEKLELTHGEQEINFTYVKDIVDAYLKSIDFITSSNYQKYEVFNIGASQAYKLKSVGEMLEKISGKKNIFSFTLPYPQNEVMYISCDYQKANKILNWSPKTNIMDGLTRTYLDYLKDTK